MKRKVVLAFLLTGALVLSGCSKTNNSNETSSGSTSTDSSAQRHRCLKHVFRQR